jgi:hypothetical protein
MGTSEYWKASRGGETIVTKDLIGSVLSKVQLEASYIPLK